jgi:hypothetical protein
VPHAGTLDDDRTWLMASIARLLVSLGGCMLGDMRHLFLWR